MNLVLFIVVLIVSFIVVRIGAIAFQLTGLEWSDWHRTKPIRESLL